MLRLILSIMLLGLCLTAKAQIIINEVLYDPSNTALEGDANGDGTYDQTQDEFIEIINRTASDIDISRYRILDRVIATGVTTVRHRMDSNLVIPAGGCVVVFGGGSAAGSFGGSHVEVDAGTAGLSMQNSGERVLLADSSGNLLDSLDTDALSDNPNESYTRSPDVTGADFIQHHVASAGVPFSPGTKADGSPFNTVMFLTKSLNNASCICTGPIEKSFRIGGNKPLPFQKEILDSRGKCLKTLSEGESEFSMQGLPAGVYQVRILASKSQNLKFILH